MAIIKQINSSKNIKNIRSWMSSVLNNKYYDMLRRKYKTPTICIDLISEEISMEYNTCDDKYVDEAQVRREVAYLAETYRNMIVKYYIHGEKVQKIADDMGIPKGTVLSRLSVGREKIKERFNKIENHEKQSYQLEKLDISNNGSQGFHDEPWSLVANDLMKQNILIVAYEKPVSCVEIAKALGIPTAYVENVIHDLTASELMKKIGSKYFTDFMITKPEDKLKRLNVEIKLVETHYLDILQKVKSFVSKLQKAEILSQLSDSKKRKLEYYFILHLFSSAIYTVIKRIIPSKEEFPQRPDGGRWIAIGSRYPQNFDFENYRVGKYCYAGCREAYFEDYLNSKTIDLKIYDTQPI